VCSRVGARGSCVARLLFRLTLFAPATMSDQHSGSENEKKVQQGHPSGPGAYTDVAPQAGLAAEADERGKNELKRNLKGRHMQMIAM
jgi:amino acid permease